VLKKVFSIYWNAPGGRPIMVALLMLLASLSDLFSMGGLVPLITQITSDGGQNQSPIAQYVLGAFSRLGIEPSFLNLLAFVGTGLILKSVISMASLSYVGISVADVTTKIRTKLLDAMMHAKWSYFVDHKPGEVASQISAQSTLAGEAYQAAAGHVVTLIPTIGMFVAAFLLSGKLALFSIIAAALLVMPLGYILMLADRSAKTQWQASNDLTTGLEDVVNNMKPLKSMGKQDRFIAGFTDNIKNLRSSQIQKIISTHGMYYGQDILAMIMVISGIYVGIVLLKTPLSQFLAFGVVFYQLIDLIKRVQLSLQTAAFASAGYFGVLETIKRSQAQAETLSGKAEPHLKQHLEFHDVSFGYPQKPVLSGINLKIPVNAITVLVGPSGAGKTTLVDLVIGLIQPTAGHISIDGQKFKDIDIAKWRGQIGYVPQELTLLRGTVFDNIVMGDKTLSETDVTQALQLAGASEFVAALTKGVHSDIGTMGGKLSGGQRQRLSLARALVHQPKLLLLDEVTSALDEHTEAEICQNIKALSGGLTILAITHRPAWTKIASKTYRIQEGKAMLEVPRRKTPQLSR
jgi:ATP-binding cassette, subfamily C, bacterial